MRAENDNGANIVAQIALRGNGIVMAWQGTVHPFRMKPSWKEIEDLPWEEQKAKIKDPDFKKKIIEEEQDWIECEKHKTALYWGSSTKVMTKGALESMKLFLKLPGGSNRTKLIPPPKGEKGDGVGYIV